MKKTLIILLCTVFYSVNAVAQAETEEIAIAMSLFGKTKKEIITDYIKLSLVEEKEFWNLYDEYQEKNMMISYERMDLLQKFARNYATLDNELAKELGNEFLSNTDRYNSLYKTYLRKFTRLVGGIKAATLFQVETYIQTSAQARLQSQIPIIGELKNVKN